MVSVNRLLKRKSDFQIQDYMIDSGAFTRISKGKSHLSTKKYAQIIRRWYRQKFGELLAAVSQDYLIVKKTKMSLADIQKVCILRYDNIAFHLSELEKQAEREFDRAINFYTTDLECDFEDDDYLEMESNHYDDLLHQGYLDLPYLMPVLQGQTPQDYVTHIRLYGDRLTSGMWVGVGSLVRFSQKPHKIAEILEAIKAVRPDLQLHGFGVKYKALRNPKVRELLYSADSAAAGLVMGSGSQVRVGQHDPEVALAYAEAIETNTDFRPPPKYRRRKEEEGRRKKDELILPYTPNYQPIPPPSAGFFIMNINCVYHPNESIALTLNNFDPFDTTCQKVQTMLESKKFVQQTPLHYIRTEFNNEVKTESFDFWLEQAEKLCQKFGGNEPAATTTDSFIDKNNPEQILILQQLVEKVTLLQQEVDSLKKLDSAVNEQLQRLNQRLQR